MIKEFLLRQIVAPNADNLIFFSISQQEEKFVLLMPLSRKLERLSLLKCLSLVP